MDTKDRHKLRRKRVADGLAEFIGRHTGAGGDTVEDVAAYVGLSRKQLDQRMHGNRDHGPTALGVHELVALTHALEDASLINLVCRLCGGSFLPDGHQLGESHPERSLQHALDLLSAAWQETGESMSVSAEVLHDKIATAEEKVRVEKEINEAILALNKLYSAIKSMPEHASAARAINLGGTP